MHRLEPNTGYIGAIFYGKALCRLGRNLQDRLLSRDPANVVAALMLSWYEVSRPLFPINISSHFQSSWSLTIMMGIFTILEEWRR